MNDTIRANRPTGILLKLTVVWLSVFILGGFLISDVLSAESVTMSVIPEVPKTGDPVVSTFNISNPTDEPLTTEYQLYINGKLTESGTTVVAPEAGTKYQYVYQHTVERGEQVNFLKGHIEQRGHKTIVVDVGTGGVPTFEGDITRQEIAKAGGSSMEEIRASQDRYKAHQIMIKGAIGKLKELYATGKLDGIISIGGASATFIATSIMKALPFGYTASW